MNILYLAPYKQTDSNGILSLFILINLIKAKLNITARPIFFGNAPILDFITDDIQKIENNVLDHYDVVIQVNYPNQAIKIYNNAVKQNILIPILNEELPSDDTIHKMNEFDKVLIDKRSKYNILSSLNKNLSSKLHTYDYDIPITIEKNNQFNLGVLSNTKKIYTIVDANNNITNIYSLCCAFIKNISYNEYSLIIYAYNIDQNIKNTIDSLISKVYSESGIKYSINRITLIPIEATLDNIATAHQTGSIYIDLENNSLNTKFAEFVKNPTIVFNHEDYAFEMSINNRIKIDGYMSLKINSIDEKINRLINSNFIEQPIPFKKNNIAKLI